MKVGYSYQMPCHSLIYFDVDGFGVIPLDHAYLCDTHHRQTFALPNSIMHYLTKNPSSAKGYQKIIQTCKYFFSKNPILVIPELYFKYEEDQWCISSHHVLADLEYLACKIWITDKLSFITNKSYIEKISSLTPKIYQSNVKELSLWRQTVFFDDFVFLASKCQKIILCCLTVIDQNSFIVPLEELVGVLKDLVELEYCDNASKIITSKTVQGLLEIPHFLNLHYFKLFNAPETFDIESFYTHLMENKKTKIYLDFVDEISEQHQIRLQTIVNKILATESREFKVPLIRFPGNDIFSSTTLCHLYNQG